METTIDVKRLDLQALSEMQEAMRKASNRIHARAIASDNSGNTSLAKKFMDQAEAVDIELSTLIRYKRWIESH